MNKIKLAVISLVAIMGIVTFVPSYNALAAPAGEIGDGVKEIGGDDSADLGTNIQTIVNILLFILGAIAVVMIIIGGIKYTTSNGDSAAVTSAKNTILYSVVGLIVAILAYAIVNFVINAF